MEPLPYLFASIRFWGKWNCQGADLLDSSFFEFMELKVMAFEKPSYLLAVVFQIHGIEGEDGFKNRAS